MGSISAMSGPTSTCSDPNLTEFGPTPTNFGPNSAKFRPGSASSGLKSANLFLKASERKLLCLRVWTLAVPTFVRVRCDQVVYPCLRLSSTSMRRRFGAKGIARKSCRDTRHRHCTENRSLVMRALERSMLLLLNSGLRHLCGVARPLVVVALLRKAAHLLCRGNAF